MIKVGIIGATGYTGVELLRILSGHPAVEVTVVTSRELAGTPVHARFPNLRGHLDLNFSDADTPLLSECDVVFYATPHNVAMNTVPALLEAGAKVIDLSADFRIKDVALWEQWYKTRHVCPELIDEAVYGLPEVNREAISRARLIAVPGCYPTAVQLGYLPLLEAGLVETRGLIADAKSGVSGAGRKAVDDYLLCESSESIKAYAIGGHRHHPEITQGLSLAAGASVSLLFVPHLTPMIRGILATLYAPVKTGSQITASQLQSLFQDRYADEPFVNVLEAGELPATRDVKGSNFCEISVAFNEATDTIVILSAIDNLVKGAAGQAVQNMNILFGLPEDSGLKIVALLP